MPNEQLPYIKHADVTKDSCSIVLKGMPAFDISTLEPALCLHYSASPEGCRKAHLQEPQDVFSTPAQQNA